MYVATRDSATFDARGIVNSVFVEIYERMCEAGPQRAHVRGEKHDIETVQF